MAHDVFISYSSHDKPFADAACSVLEQHGLRCWIAPRDLLPGVDWGGAIVEAIEAARVFVLVFSANANSSLQVKREVERAVAKGLSIVPVRIEDVVPTKHLEYFISTSHWLDALTPPMERHLEYLADVINRIVNSGDAARPPGVKPQETVSPPAAANHMTLIVAVAVGAAVLASGAWLATRSPGLAPQIDKTRTDSPAGAYDTRLSGIWKLTVPIPNGIQEWTMILADGRYDLTIATAGQPVPYSEAGGFSASGGIYHWTPPAGDAFDGSYRVISADAVEMTGPLGTATWRRHK